MQTVELNKEQQQLKKLKKRRIKNKQKKLVARKTRMTKAWKHVKEWPPNVKMIFDLADKISFLSIMKNNGFDYAVKQTGYDYEVEFLSSYKNATGPQLDKVMLDLRKQQESLKIK